MANDLDEMIELLSKLEAIEEHKRRIENRSNKLKHEPIIHNCRNCGAPLVYAGLPISRYYCEYCGTKY